MRFSQKQPSPERIKKDYERVEQVVNDILNDNPRWRIDPRATWTASSEAKKWNTQEQAKIAEVIRLADAYRQQKKIPKGKAKRPSGDIMPQSPMEALIKRQLHLALFSSLPAPPPSTKDPMQQLRDDYATKIAHLTRWQLRTHPSIPEAIRSHLKAAQEVVVNYDSFPVSLTPKEKLINTLRTAFLKSKLDNARENLSQPSNGEVQSGEWDIESAWKAQADEEDMKAAQKVLKNRVDAAERALFDHRGQIIKDQEKKIKTKRTELESNLVEVQQEVSGEHSPPQVVEAQKNLDEFNQKVNNYHLAIAGQEAIYRIALEQARACAAQIGINAMQAELEKNDKLKALVAQSKAIAPIGYKAQMEQEKLQSEHNTKLWDAINEHVYNDPQDANIAQKIKTQADGSVQVSVKGLSDVQVQAAAKAALIQYQGGTPPKPITLENLSELKITDSDPPGFKTACLKALYEQLELTHGEDKKEDIKANMKKHFSIEETDIDQVFKTATVEQKRDSEPLKEAVETLNAEHKAAMDRIKALKSTATTTQESPEERAGDSPGESPDKS